MKPEIIEGGRHEDGRGSLRFCNGFDMTEVKRFYTIANSMEEPIRGWIGHKKETKWFFPLRGATEIAVEPMDGETLITKWAEVAKETIVRFTLNAKEPKVLKIPPSNWFCIKQDGNAEVMVFSNCKVGEFKDDDFRRPY